MPKKKEELEVTAGAAAEETTENSAEVEDLEETPAEQPTESPESAPAEPGQRKRNPRRMNLYPRLKRQPPKQRTPRKRKPQQRTGRINQRRLLF